LMDNAYIVLIIMANLENLGSLNIRKLNALCKMKIKVNVDLYSALS